MPDVANYSAQSYDPPMIQAFPSRGWCSGRAVLGAATVDLFFIDGIVVYRGLAATLGTVSPSIPGAGQNLRIDMQVNISGISFMPQENVGDGTFNNMWPAPGLYPVGFNQIYLPWNGFHFKAQVARLAAGGNAEILFCVSILGYA